MDVGIPCQYCKMWNKTDARVCSSCGGNPRGERNLDMDPTLFRDAVERVRQDSMKVMTEGAYSNRNQVRTWNLRGERPLQQRALREFRYQPRQTISSESIQLGCYGLYFLVNMLVGVLSVQYLVQVFFERHIHWFLALIIAAVVGSPAFVMAVIIWALKTAGVI